MSDDITCRIKQLPEPTAVDLKTFDDLLKENLLEARKYLSDDWIPLESDPYVKNLRILTARQLHNQSDKNHTIRELLITTATGTDLDHLGIDRRGIQRLKGVKPQTKAIFKISSPISSDVYIPKDTLLTSSSGEDESVVLEDGLISSGSLETTLQVELQRYIESSPIQCTTIVTDLPFVAAVSQLGDFDNGASGEDDDRYRERIIKSFVKYNTAGSEDAYKYHTYTADSRIDDVVVLSEKALEVDIFIASFSGVNQEMIDRVSKALNQKNIRPIGDLVTVKRAMEKPLNIEVAIELFDLLRAGEIEKRIRANFNQSFFIGQNFVSSDLIRKCHIDGVYRVDSDFTDVICNKKEIINLIDLKLNFKRAVV